MKRNLLALTALLVSTATFASTELSTTIGTDWSSATTDVKTVSKGHTYNERLDIQAGRNESANKQYGVTVSVDAIKSNSTFTNKAFGTVSNQSNGSFTKMQTGELVSVNGSKTGNSHSSFNTTNKSKTWTEERGFTVTSSTTGNPFAGDGLPGDDFYIKVGKNSKTLIQSEVPHASQIEPTKANNLLDNIFEFDQLNIEDIHVSKLGGFNHNTTDTGLSVTTYNNSDITTRTEYGTQQSGSSTETIYSILD